LDKLGYFYIEVYLNIFNPISNKLKHILKGIDILMNETYEISQTMSLRRAFSSICMIIIIGLTFYFSLVVIPNIIPTFEATIGALLAIVIVGGGTFILLLDYLWMYRGASIRRIFTISPEGIKIVVPRQLIFNINWSEFDLIQLRKTTVASSSIHMASHRAYRFNFISNDEIYKDFIIIVSIHFNRVNCRAIASQMEQYAVKMNKQFIRGKIRKKKKKN